MPSLATRWLGDSKKRPISLPNDGYMARLEGLLGTPFAAKWPIGSCNEANYVANFCFTQRSQVGWRWTSSDCM